MKRFAVVPVAILTMSFATVITGPPRGHYLADLKIDKQVFKLLLHPKGEVSK